MNLNTLHSKISSTTFGSPTLSTETKPLSPLRNECGQSEQRFPTLCSSSLAQWFPVPVQQWGLEPTSPSASASPRWPKPARPEFSGWSAPAPRRPACFPQSLFEHWPESTKSTYVEQPCECRLWRGHAKVKTHFIELHRVFDLLHLFHSVLDHLLNVYSCPLKLCLHSIRSHGHDLW